MDIFADITNQLSSLTGMALYCFIASQIVGLIATGLGIAAGQANKPRTILVLEITLNLLCAVASLLVQAYTGAVMCFVASAVAIAIFYFREIRKQSDLPKWFIAVSAVSFVVAGLLSFVKWYDVLPIAAALLFMCSLVSKRPTGYRIFMLTNSCLWIVYHFITTAYTSILTQLFLAISLALGIIRLDILKKKDK